MYMQVNQLYTFIESVRHTIRKVENLFKTTTRSLRPLRYTAKPARSKLFNKPLVAAFVILEAGLDAWAV